MERGDWLTEHEKGIIAFEKDEYSQWEIAKNIKRSRYAVKMRTKLQKRFQVGQKKTQSKG